MNFHSKLYASVLTSFQPEIKGLVRRYSPLNTQGNLWEEDVRQECAVALARIIENGKIAPDPETGELTKFERSVAYVEMRHAVHKLTVPLHSSLSVSAGSHDKYRKLRAAYLRLQPGADWSKTAAADIAAVLCVPNETARNLLTLGQARVNLNAPVSWAADQTATTEDFLADETVEHPSLKLDRAEFISALRPALARLTASQREVITRRFGLNASCDEESCADIAASRGRARQSVDEQCRIAIGHLRAAFLAKEPALAA